MPLEIVTQQISPDTAVLTLSGSLTLGTDLKIADRQIQTMIAGGVSRLVLDLSGVPYIDSAGLGALVHTYGLTQQSHGTLRLCGVQDRIVAMLKMTRSDAFLPIDPDAAASLAAIQATPA